MAEAILLTACVSSARLAPSECTRRFILRRRAKMSVGCSLAALLLPPYIFFSLHGFLPLKPGPARAGPAQPGPARRRPGEGRKQEDSTRNRNWIAEILVSAHDFFCLCLPAANFVSPLPISFVFSPQTRNPCTAVYV